MSFTRSRCARALAAGTLSVALLSAGTAAAFAANEKPTPTPTMHMTGKPKPTVSPMAKASITLTANKSSVTAGQSVRLAGRTTGLKVGSPLALQHEVNGKWTKLTPTTVVKRNNSYAMTAKLPKGTHTLRVVSANKAGKAVSPTVTVKVS
ncbi:hypothetical protein [Streptomyces monashensis]|uniref:Bacterial Ig-like domain-containing protein n=1 Tax=Streptomyces monashensis TaxID=1678012 RepID=A0A1S2QE73_9ACTN|nr:hypothetical protein [Streptomyces monashensis]OIK04458.1 hypothetical protein BIV23_16995 [Streptomyces monashensis]